MVARNISQTTRQRHGSIDAGGNVDGSMEPLYAQGYGTAATTRRLGFLPTLRRVTSRRRAQSRIDTSLLSTLLTQQYLPSGLNATQFGPWPTPTLPTTFLPRVS